MNETRSGQALILAVMLLVVLLAAFSAILFLNRTVTLHSVKSQQRLKSRAVTEEGLSYALQQLSTFGTPPPFWPFAQGLGNLPSPEIVTSVQGSSFTVTYSSPPNTYLQSYQVGIITRTFDGAGKIIPGSSLFTQVSQKTVGVKLPIGLTSWAALEVNHAPSGPLVGGVPSPIPAGSALYIYNGPILNHDVDNTGWTLDAWSDGCQMPRKFSAKGITGGTFRRAPTTSDAPTDQQEYWAYASPAGVSTINLNASPVATSYQGLAQSELGVCPAPQCVSGPCTGSVGGAGTAMKATPPGSCYFQMGTGDVALFDGGYTLNAINTNPPTVLYVSGNAQFGQVRINVEPAGAVIVDAGPGGFLNLADNGDPAAGNVNGVFEPLPPTCKLEGPYNDPPATCGGAAPQPEALCGANGCCSSANTQHKIEIGGFLYATGDLNITAPRWWSIDGVVRVDGNLTLSAGNLQITGSDIVNHNILTSSFELQVDSITVIP